jgi:hypothetical protein
MNNLYNTPVVEFKEIKSPGLRAAVLLAQAVLELRRAGTISAMEAAAKVSDLVPVVESAA